MLPIRDTVAMYGLREEWTPGDVAWFEYHCYEGHDSADAELWYHSHQRVTVEAPAESDGWADDPELSTFDRRQDAGAPRAYRIRFTDGRVFTAVEDELFTLPQFFYRPDPPRGAVS